MDSPRVIDNSHQPNKTTNRTAKLSKSQKKLILIIVGILLVIGSYVAVYKWGNSKGYSAGYNNGKKDAAKTANPFNNFLNSTANPFRAVSGSVTEISKDKITVNTVQGQKSTIKIDDKTKVSQKTEMKSIKDIKVGKQITVFTQGEGDNATATRIVIREK